MKNDIIFKIPFTNYVVILSSNPIRKIDIEIINTKKGVII